MLVTQTRKKIISNTWSEMIKKDKNHYQTWDRIRTQAKRAIDDLILLAEKLPEDKRLEIFTDDKTEVLFRYLLPSSFQLDSRKAKLAKLFLQRGIMYFTFEYDKIQPNETLREPIKQKLLETLILCTAISSEIENMEKKKELHRPKCGTTMT